MIKKIILFAFTCMLFLVCAKAKTEKKYLALGDSITAGYLLDDPDKDSFASLFSKKYGFTLTNEAVSGDESGELLEKLDNYDIASYDVITLCIGANDVLGEFIDKYMELSKTEMIEFLANIDSNEEFNNKINENLEVLDKNLEKIMSIVKSGDAQIYMMNIYNPYKNNVITMLEPIAEKYISKINNVIEKYAKADGVYFIDLYKTFKKTNKIVINSQSLSTMHDPHPNINGHKLIANKLIESYDKNNPTIENIIIAVIIGVVVVILEVVEMIYTLKKHAVKPIIKDNDRPNITENKDNTNNSSRFIRS